MIKTKQLEIFVSNIGDSEKVLATVVASVYAFTDRYKGVSVYATGSTEARTRLYRMGINKYFEEVKEDFEVYGLFENEWIDFNGKIDCEAFLVKRKKT